LFVRGRDANNSLIKVPTAAIEERALLLGDTYGLGASAALEATAAMKDGSSQICVIGCDPYGASALISLKSTGTAGVIALDNEERRLGLARRLGGTTFDTSDEDVANAVQEATGGNGPGAVIIGAGVESSQVELGLRLVQPGGIVVLTEPNLPGWQAPEFVDDRGITIRAAAPPTRADVSKSMLELWGGTLELDSLVTHVMPLIDAESGYAQLHARERGAHKILLKM
jgi:threonine dehydrogenase-like Zn-dependent dehydrogenase